MGMKDQAVLNRIAKLIREEGPLTVGEICIRTGYSVWVVEKLRPTLLEIYPDLRYARRTFYVEKEGEEVTA